MQQTITPNVTPLMGKRWFTSRWAMGYPMVSHFHMFPRSYQCVGQRQCGFRPQVYLHTIITLQINIIFGHETWQWRCQSQLHQYTWWIFQAMSDYRGVTQTDSKICTSPKEVGFPTVGSNRFGPDPRDQWHCQESPAEIGWLSLSQCSLFILVGYSPLTTCEHTHTHTRRFFLWTKL